MVLSDLFLDQNLNPLFINSLREFWIALEQAKPDNPQQVKLTQINLIRFIFRRLFQPLYFKYPPQVEGSVFFLTKVHTDGIGDYISLLKCAKILKEAHPKLRVQAAYLHYQDLPPVNTDDYLLPPSLIHGFFESQEEEVLEPVLKGEEVDEDHPLHIKAKNLYGMLDESLAIVHIALALNTFDNPQFAKKSFYFSETGNFQGIGNYLQRNWYSMGLQPFEEGIFLRRTFDDTVPWHDLRLPSLMEGGANPQLGYISKIPEQLVLYIYLECLLQKDKPGDLVILIPKLLKKGQMNFNIGWLKDHGIAKMVIEKEVILDTGIDQGKTIHFYPAFPMATSDFEKAVSHCGTIVGCTGDGSLSDCLIAEKIPFYELRKHKQETWEAFQMLAKHLQLGDVEAYFKALIGFQNFPLETTAEELYTIVVRASFEPQWKSIINFIKKYDRFEEALLAHLNRHFYLQQNPAVQAKEEELINKYYNGKISSEEAFKDLENLLRTHPFVVKDFKTNINDNA